MFSSFPLSRNKQVQVFQKPHNAVVLKPEPKLWLLLKGIIQRGNSFNCQVFHLFRNSYTSLITYSSFQLVQDEVLTLSRLLLDLVLGLTWTWLCCLDCSSRLDPHKTVLKIFLTQYMHIEQMSKCVLPEQKTFDTIFGETLCL